jgi:hypothetical protein
VRTSLGNGAQEIFFDAQEIQKWCAVNLKWCAVISEMVRSILKGHILKKKEAVFSKQPLVLSIFIFRT